ncbi:hypothetical protein EK904_004477 [Melospiza melodia maxima]|nr:hypothetical protein EK904_004477 [Melospiza melodia maxima]
MCCDGATIRDVPGNEQQQFPEETVNIAKSAFTAGVVGWLYGGLPAFVSARKAFIESSHGEIFQNRADAVLLTCVPCLCSVVSTGLSAYRDKTTISNFAAAGAFTGALFRVHLGLQGLAGGVVFGTAFGVPAGGLLMAMYGLAGETLQEKRSRERRELYEQRLAEWQSRLSRTEILGQTESNAQGRPEMERATELKSY